MNPIHICVLTSVQLKTIRRKRQGGKGESRIRGKDCCESWHVTWPTELWALPLARTLLLCNWSILDDNKVWINQFIFWDVIRLPPRYCGDLLIPTLLLFLLNPMCTSLCLYIMCTLYSYQTSALFTIDWWQTILSDQSEVIGRKTPTWSSPLITSNNQYGFLERIQW